MRTEPLELPREEEEGGLDRDGAEREPEEMRGEDRVEDRETDGEEERILLDGELDLGAEKTDRDEDPEKGRNRGTLLLRDGVEREIDREGEFAEGLRLLKPGICPRSRLPLGEETRPLLREGLDDELVP